MEPSADGRMSPVKPDYSPAATAAPSDPVPTAPADPSPQDDLARARARRRLRPLRSASPRFEADPRIRRVVERLKVESLIIALELRFDRLTRQLISHRLLSVVRQPVAFAAQDEDVRVRTVLEALAIDGHTYVLELRFDGRERILIGHRLLRAVG